MCHVGFLLLVVKTKRGLFAKCLRNLGEKSRESVARATLRSPSPAQHLKEIVLREAQDREPCENTSIYRDCTCL